MQDAGRDLVGRDLQDLPHEPRIHPAGPLPLLEILPVGSFTVLRGGEGEAQDESEG